MKIFWSWQSDTPGNIGRFFVREALKEAIDQLKQAPDVEEPTSAASRDALHLDHDRQGVPGSPDLARTILDKIDVSAVVIADVTLVGKTPDKVDSSGKVTQTGKKLINANVAIELGYAIRALTDRNVLMVFNSYYGKHDDLPFDLRHKGGSLVFDLPPDADKKRIQEAKKILTADFVKALSPYIQTASPAASLSFEETSSTFNKATYFQGREVLAQIGEPKIDQESFAYVTDNLCYLRLIPTKRLDRPISLAAARDVVKYAPVLAFQLSGALTSINNYGAIRYEPGNKVSSEMKGIFASTQLFQNGELWAVNASLVITERGLRPAHIKLPILPCLAFERTYYDALPSAIKFMSEQLGLSLPWQVELGLAATNGLHLGMDPNDFWGPIRRPDVVYRATLNSDKPDALNELLLMFFAAVYDASGYARPKNHYGFPPKRPGSR